MTILRDKLIDYVIEVTDGDDLAVDSVKCGPGPTDLADLRAQKRWWSKAKKTVDGWESDG